jgi:hypothetical protein
MRFCIMAVSTGEMARPAGRNDHGVAPDLMLLCCMTGLAGKILTICIHVHVMVPGRRKHG